MARYFVSLRSGAGPFERIWWADAVPERARGLALAEYERLRSGRTGDPSIDALPPVGELAAHARISRGRK